MLRTAPDFPEMRRLSQSPTDPGFVQDPYPFYARALELGDFVLWEDYGFPCAVSYRAVNAMLRDRRAGRPPPPELAQAPPERLRPFYDVEASSMLETEPPVHTRLRRAALAGFTSRRVSGLAPEIDRLCHELIDRFPSGEFDLLAHYAQAVPVTIIARLLGIPDSMGARLLDWSHKMVAMYQARKTRQIEDQAVEATREFLGYLSGIIAARREAPGDDLLSSLVSDGELGEGELASTAMLLLNAGHEATVHSMGNAVSALVSRSMNPVGLSGEAMESLVEELLRFDPPLHMFCRHVYEDMSAFGHDFKRGDKVGLLLACANRDPAEFKDPGSLIPSRGRSRHLSFGAGLHFCLGAPLARLELSIGLRALFERCPNLRIASKPAYADIYHFHGLGRLMVAKD